MGGVRTRGWQVTDDDLERDTLDPVAPGKTALTSRLRGERRTTDPDAAAHPLAAPVQRRAAPSRGGDDPFALHTGSARVVQRQTTTPGAAGHGADHGHGSDSHGGDSHGGGGHGADGDAHATGAGAGAGDIQITSQAFSPAANGAPATRRTIGVGETVMFRASRRGEWTGPSPLTGSRRDANFTFDQPGDHEVRVRDHGHEGSITMHVVAPSLRVRKVSDHALSDPTEIGAWMELELSVTPTGVSFASLELHEEECGPTGAWGYFQTHASTYARAMHHRPSAPEITGVQRPPWVGLDNGVVRAHDHAAIRFYYRDINWPLRSGGFQWQIPVSYQINGVQHRFARAVSQSFHMDDNGTLTIWKGGEHVTRSPAASVQQRARQFREEAAQAARERQPTQRRADRAIDAEPSEIQAAADRGVAGGGGALPHLDRIQAAFGHHDVSGVRAHVGGAAAEASASIGAQAYATGHDVAFAHDPDLHLAAHEAAHVVQQRGGVSLAGGVGEAGDVYERHADAVADAVVRGDSAEELLDGGADPPSAT